MELSNPRFEVLVKCLSKAMTKNQLARVKRSLHGHMDKKSLNQIHRPDALFFFLRHNKLLSAQKTSFLKKILQQVDDGEKKNLVKMIDDFKSSCLRDKENRGIHLTSLMEMSKIYRVV